MNGLTEEVSRGKQQQHQNSLPCRIQRKRPSSFLTATMTAQRRNVLLVSAVIFLGTVLQFRQFQIEKARYLAMEEHQSKMTGMLNMTVASWMETLVTKQDLAIFYNVWLPMGDNATRRREIQDTIIAPQITLLGDSFAVKNHTHAPVDLYYIRIGHPVSDEWMTSITAQYNLRPVPLRLYDTAFEEVTLDNLWNYCKIHPRHDVIYVHPKGSYHPSTEQDKWRAEGTIVAGSQQCADSMEHTQCNACGTRFMTMPNHFSGNFWRAKCSYIQKLKPAKEMADLFKLAYDTRPAPTTFITAFESVPHLGLERFGSEQWIGSHPDMFPCPLKTEFKPYKRHDYNKIKDDISARKREFFLLPGLLWRYATMYGDTTFPPDDSWIWKHFPDGEDFLAAVHTQKSLKAAVMDQMTNPTAAATV